MNISFPECARNEELIVLLKDFIHPCPPAGAIIIDENENPLFQITDQCWRQTDQAFMQCLKLLALNPVAAGERHIRVRKTGWSVAAITLSDKGAAGKRVDQSGPLILELIKPVLKPVFSRQFLLADEPGVLKTLLAHLALVCRYDLIITTGGTGVGERDNTPQVTSSLLDLSLPGITQAMMAASLAKTPNAVISRAAAGIIGRSLIINLPGSVKAVRENLNAVLPALDHCLAKINGDDADCGTDK